MWCHAQCTFVQLRQAFLFGDVPSDDNLTEDPEVLVNPHRCFLVRRNKPLVEKKPKDIQLEEVKALWKTLSTEQIEEIKKKNTND